MQLDSGHEDALRSARMTNPARSRLVTGHRIFITMESDLTYDEQRAALLADLDGKRFRGDWHGVSDAATDLRVLEAEQKIRTEERELDRPERIYDPAFARRAFTDTFASPKHHIPDHAVFVPVSGPNTRS